MPLDEDGEEGNPCMPASVQQADADAKWAMQGRQVRGATARQWHETIQLAPFSQLTEQLCLLEDEGQDVQL